MKIKKNFYLLSVLFSTICCMAGVQANSADDLQAKLSDFHSMTADFDQKIVDQYGSTLQDSTGKMAIERPGKFRWQTLQPNKQLIVTDGRRLWIYDEDLEQVTVQRFEQNPDSVPALLLSGSLKNLQQRFDVNEKEKGGLQLFTLLPKDQQQDEIFQRVILTFKQDKVNKMQFTDGLGQRTDLQFSHVRLNQTLSPGLFLFKAPEGVDVINQD